MRDRKKEKRKKEKQEKKKSVFRIHLFEFLKVDDQIKRTFICIVYSSSKCSSEVQEKARTSIAYLDIQLVLFNHILNCIFQICPGQITPMFPLNVAQTNSTHFKRAT